MHKSVRKPSRSDTKCHEPGLAGDSLFSIRTNPFGFLRGPQLVNNLHRSLVIGTSALALVSCGADSITSPGTGGNITINNPPAPAPTPTPTPAPTGPALVTPAGSCPTISNPIQLVNEGTISGPTGTYRVCAMPARFTASTTLTYIPGLLYRMTGRTDVGTDGGPVATAADTNVTLTLQPGVIVYASGSAWLNVNRGNRINATGTAARPIIFTSQDNVVGFNTINSSGQWGGVVLSGRAQITDCAASGATPGTVACERQVEGAADPALYGGATNTDNSGTMSFVQIRYSGFVLSGNSELQALTTGGTGTGTTLNNIMTYNSSDDGVEFFGGSVNVRNLIVVGHEDDGLDTDTGVKANMQNVIVVMRPGTGDTIIEADTSGSSLENQTPRQNTQISNATFIANSGVRDQAIRIRGGTDYTIVNSILIDAGTPATPCLRIDDASTIQTTGADELGAPRFNSFVLDCATDFRAGSSVTLAQTQAIYDAGTNNNSAFTRTLTGLFINGANENAVTVFNPTTLSSFFTNPTNIGAVYPGNNTWINGWTCNSATATFDTAVSSCLALPVYT